MDALAPMLQAFYTQPISSEQRISIHNTLVTSLSDPTHQHAAIAYIRALTAAPHNVNPFLLHHALHTIDTLARTALPSLPAGDQLALLQLLFSFLASAHGVHLADPAAGAQQIPPHVLNKAAAATVSLGKRHWLAGAAAFPDALHTHLNSPAHTPASLAAMLTGHAVLTTLLDDAQSTRRDLRSADQTRLRALIAERRHHFLPALEIALRAAGPAFPSHLAPAAARAVASLARLDRTAAAEGAAILARCAVDRRDPVAATLFSALVDIVSSAAVVDTAPLVDSVAAALEALAAGAAADRVFPPALLAVVDALTPRLVNLPQQQQQQQSGLERVLNGLMGITVRWADHQPGWLPRALDTWISVLEHVEDADDVRESPLMSRVYPAVSQVCVARMLMSSNAPLLRALAARRRDALVLAAGAPLPRPERPREWDAGAELTADVAREPHGPSTAALFFKGRSMGVDVVHDEDDVADDDDDDDEEEDEEGWDQVSRHAYIMKAVETLVFIAQMSDTVANEAAQLVINTIKTRAPAAVAGGFKGEGEEAAEDITSVAMVAFGLSGVLGASSPGARGVLEASVDLLSKGAWRRVQLGVTLFRTAAALTGVLGSVVDSAEGADYAKQVGTVLAKVAQEVYRDPRNGAQLQSASAVALCCLDNSVRRAVFGDSPAFEVEAVTRATRAASCVGAARLARYAVIPQRNGGVRTKWSDQEWAQRVSGLQMICGKLVGEVTGPGASGEQLAELGRLSGMVRTIAFSIRNEGSRPAGALWEALGSRIINELLREGVGLRATVALARSSNDTSMQSEAWAVASSMIAAVGDILSVCGGSGANTSGAARATFDGLVAVGRECAGLSGGVRVALAVLKVVRERVSSGDASMVAAAVELAMGVSRGAVGTSPEAGELSLSVLGEALRRHWLTFWPGDRIKAHGINGENTQAQPTEPDGPTRAIYQAALGALIEGAGVDEISMTRAALLELSRLDAARRLFARKAAFQDTGATRVLAGHCFQVLGGGGDARRESVSDEAIDVLWGMCSAEGTSLVADLPIIISDISGGLDNATVTSLCNGLSAEAGRADFARRVTAMASDMVYLRTLKPSL